MIQIYNPGNTDFTKNGDMTLLPTDASVHAILNGAWTANLSHLIDGEGRWKYIQEEAVVKLPSFNGDQLFRIKKKEKSDSGITAELEPIFMDSMADCFLLDVRPTGKNGQQTLDVMMAGNKKYSGKSDITAVNTAYYEYMNLIEAINGDNENSFVNRWGGEILFDNFRIIINERVGGDYGVELRYGKNIPQDGLIEEVDIRDVVTRIYPKAYNGHKMTGTGYVDSTLIGNYPTIKTATITFEDVKMQDDEQEDDKEKGVIICKNQTELNNALKKRCQEQFAAGLDKPKVTISADMILLAGVEQYKDYTVLEEVSIGDTIHCRNSRLDIVTDARVIELEYDCLKKKVSSVVLGDYTYNYFNNVTSAVNRIDQAIRPDGTVIAEQIKGFIDGALASLRAQYDVAKKQDVMAVLFENMDKTSQLYGAMALGTQGLMISKTRTADDRDWDWTTAMTAEGLIADIIVAGIISDQKGRNYWNLNTGEMRVDGNINSRNFTAKQGTFEVKTFEDTYNSVSKLDIACKMLSNVYEKLVGRTIVECGSTKIRNEMNEASGIEMRSYPDEIMFCGVQKKDGWKNPTKIYSTSVKQESIKTKNLTVTGKFDNQSDVRLKDNIEFIADGELEKIAKVPIVSFDWLESQEHESAGVIAQDIEKVYPDCVHEKDGVKYITPIKLIYRIIKAVQELNDKVNGTRTPIGRIDTYTREQKLEFIEGLRKKQRKEAEERNGNRN